MIFIPLVNYIYTLSISDGLHGAGGRRKLQEEEEENHEECVDEVTVLQEDHQEDAVK
jgi:hypothetical protein